MAQRLDSPEVIAIDDGSTDGSDEIIHAEFGFVHLCAPLTGARATTKRNVSVFDPSSDLAGTNLLEAVRRLSKVWPTNRERIRPQAIAIRGCSSHAFRPFANELRAWGVRIRSRNARRHFEGALDLLMNLGSGETGRTGWKNMDIAARSGVTCVYDCRKQLPFSGDSARMIFAEHFFEHLDYTEEVPSFPAECYRVLAPWGSPSDCCADAEAYIRAYCAGGWDDLSRLRSLSGRHDSWLDTAYNTRMELTNAVFRQGFEHKFAWDYETLEFVLRNCRFESVTRQGFGKSKLPELCIDNPQRTAESLYVEGIKCP